MVKSRPLVRKRLGEAGYTLATLAVAVTVMSILTAAALPSWSKAIQREKEEELIARGLQIAEAIRVFRGRFGRLPVRLEELVEVKPRSLRKLYKDPMTEDGKWGLLFEGLPQQPVNCPPGVPCPNPQQPGLPPGGQPPRGGGPSDDLGDDDDNGRGGDLPNDPFSTPTGLTGERVTIGPIQGVYSKSRGEATKRFFDKDSYDQWQFTYQLLLSNTGFNTPGGNGQLMLSTRPQWVGRPWRPGIVPPGQGQPPGQLPGSGQAPGGFGTGGVRGSPNPAGLPPSQTKPNFNSDEDQ